MAQKYHSNTEAELLTITHSRRTLLQDHKGNVRTKKDSKNQLDISMRAKDDEEICDLIGLYIYAYIYIHANIYFTSIVLYRDDKLAMIRSTSGSSSDRFRKKKLTDFSKTTNCKNCKIFNKCRRHYLFPKFQNIATIQET